jgi:hypothetical protein
MNGTRFVEVGAMRASGEKDEMAVAVNNARE